MPSKIRARNGIKLTQEDKQRIGRNVAKLRKDLDMTLEQLAEAIGCSTSMISHVERGTHRPSLELYIALARYFGLEPIPLV